MMPIPVKARIDVEINNSCNDCCSCWPWSKKKQVTPIGTKLQEREIIDMKIQEYKKTFHESYKQPHHHKVTFHEEKMPTL